MLEWYLDKMSLSDIIYSENIDPSITKDYIISFSTESGFPKLKGVATAHYALQNYPNMSLENAVSTYNALRKYQDSFKKVKIIKVNNRVYDHIQKYKGIIIDDWDNMKSGYLLSKIYSIEIQGRRTFSKDLILDISFLVDNEGEAIEVIENILFVHLNFNFIL